MENELKPLILGKRVTNKEMMYKERAYKAWQTMKERGFKTKKQKKQLYKNINKENQRKILIDLINSKRILFNDTNPFRDNKYLPNLIYLDSPDLFFTKELDRSELLRFFGCIIPNNIEYHKFNDGASMGSNIWGQKQIQYKEHKSGAYYEPIYNVVLENRSFKDYVNGYNNFEKKHFNTFFIWADYCGSFSSYIEDIESVFKNKLLGNNSIYAMTFCRRDVARDKKIPNYSNTNCIVAVNDYVTKIAEKYGYKVKLYNKSGFYKASMFTAIFEIEHNYVNKNLEELQNAISSYEKIISDLDNKASDINSKFKSIKNKIINEGI